MASINDLATAASVISAVTSFTNNESSLSPSTTTAHPTFPGNGSTEVVRGALIVLEGLDRSGKSTQVKLLEQRFVELGRKVKVMRFPDRSTPIGQMIDSYLRSQSALEDHVIHLLFTANRWEAAQQITSLLESGTTVLCDRYYHSGIVYSAAKQNPSLSLDWARNPEIGLPRPDLVLFLDLDETQARSRGGWGGEAYERAEMQKRVKELFWALSQGRVGTAVANGEVNGGGTASDGGMVAAGPESPDTTTALEQRFRQEEEDLRVLDASPSVEEVAEEIWRVVEPRLEAVERGESGHEVRRVT